MVETNSAEPCLTVTHVTGVSSAVSAPVAPCVGSSAVSVQCDVILPTLADPAATSGPSAAGDASLCKFAEFDDPIAGPSSVPTGQTPCSTRGSPDVGDLFCHGELSQKVVATLTAEQKRLLLTEHWIPPTEYQWPFTQCAKQKKFLRLNHISGPRYGCFKSSQKLLGVLCVPCVLFANEYATNNNGKQTALGRLVRTPLQKYNALTGKDSVLDTHLNNVYHKTVQLFSEQFLMQLQSGDIATHLDNSRKQQASENRERLIPIVKTIILSGRCGLAYRGRRDDGNLDVDKPIAVG